MKIGKRRKRWERSMRGSLREATDLMVEWFFLAWKHEEAYRRGAVRFQPIPAQRAALKRLEKRYDLPGQLAWPQPGNRNWTNQRKKKRHWPFMSPEEVVRRLRPRLRGCDEWREAVAQITALPHQVRADLAMAALEGHDAHPNH